MAATKTATPAKPDPDFPLFPHGNGRWAKKMKGKRWFFGFWGDPDAALKKYVQERDEIQAGRDPRRGFSAGRVPVGELTVAEVCNLFLARQKERSQRGDIPEDVGGGNGLGTHSENSQCRPLGLGIRCAADRGGVRC